jgi:hypothetical protein
MENQEVQAKLNQAITIVRDDTRQSYPDMTARDAVDHVRATIDADELDGDPGDPCRDAYHLVITADEAKITEALAERR